MALVPLARALTLTSLLVAALIIAHRIEAGDPLDPRPFSVVTDRAWPMLSREQALDDLNQLRAAMEDQFSYRTLRGVDVDHVFAEAEEACAESIRVDHFALLIHRLVGLFGDGHAGVRPIEAFLPQGCTPFLFGDCGDRIVAFQEDRAAFVEPKCPYIQAINGIPLDEWLTAAATLAPQGSPAFVRRHAIRHLRFIRALNLMLGDQDRLTCTVEFTDESGRKTLEREFRLHTRKPMYGEWPRRESHVRPDGIAYLRIGNMDLRDGIEARDFLEQCREVKGFVIDVRGNSGGSREPLRLVYPFFAAPQAQPLIANIAAYRASHRFNEDHLDSRFLYRPDARRSGQASLDAIARAMDGFSPTWLPPIEQFSPWHYFVLRSSHRDPTFHDVPLVILMNADCFSATDVFLGALEVLPNVTLVGTCSAGGSGRAVETQLRRSRLSVTLSSMVSYRPDGRLYDTVGIEPDIVVLPEAGYYISASDRALDRAVRVIHDREPSDGASTHTR